MALVRAVEVARLRPAALLRLRYAASTSEVLKEFAKAPRTTLQQRINVLQIVLDPKTAAQEGEEASRQFQRKLSTFSLLDLAHTTLKVKKTANSLAEGLPRPALRLQKQCIRELSAKLSHSDVKLMPNNLPLLLRCVDGKHDPLWKGFRKKFMEQTELSARDVDAVLREPVWEKVKDDHEVLQLLKQHVAKALLPPRAEMVGTVLRKLPLLVDDIAVCKAFLHAATRLRTDVFPTLLWDIFRQSASLRLVELHPSLRPRLESAGALLDGRDVAARKVKAAKMTLPDMVLSAQAMKINDIVLKRSLQEMAMEMVQVHKEAIGHPGAESAEGEQREKLAEVQEHMISFISALDVGHANPELETTIVNFLEPDRDGPACYLDADHLQRRFEAFHEVQAKARGTGQTRPGNAVQYALERRMLPLLPSMDDDFLLSRVVPGALLPEMRTSAIEEAKQRISEMGPVTSGKRWDALVGILGSVASWSRPIASRSTSRAIAPSDSEDPQLAEARVPEGFLQGLLEMTSASAMNAIAEDKADMATRQRRLATLASVLAGMRPGPSKWLEPCRNGLHELGKVKWDLESAAKLSCDFAAAYARHGLPLDVTLRLSQLLIGSLEPLQQKKITSRALSASSRAHLEVFGLALKHLSSRSTVLVVQQLHGAELLSAAIEASQAAGEDSRAGPSGKPRGQSFRQSQATKRVSPIAQDVCKQLALLESAEHCAIPVQQAFAVSGTPFTAAVALVEHKALLLDPLSEHLFHAQLNGHGLLQQRILEALGWRVAWLFPKDFGEEADEERSTFMLRRVLGDVAAVPEQEEVTENAADEAVSAVAQEDPAAASTAEAGSSAEASKPEDAIGKEAAGEAKQVQQPEEPASGGSEGSKEPDSTGASAKPESEEQGQEPQEAGKEAADQAKAAQQPSLGSSEQTQSPTAASTPMESGKAADDDQAKVQQPAKDSGSSPEAAATKAPATATPAASEAKVEAGS